MTGQKPYSEMNSSKEIKEKVAQEGIRHKFDASIPPIYLSMIS